MKKRLIDDIFYDLIPGKQKVRLNFRFEPITLDDKTRSGTFRLVLDDPRWYEKKIDNEIYYIDSIDGNMMSISTLVESFDKGKDLVYGGKGVPIYVKDFMSENKGAKTIAGLKKLIELRKFEESFLSCNSIFLRRLRVLLFISEQHEISVNVWEAWNAEKFRTAGSIIKILAKTGIFDTNYEKDLLKYCQDRNRIDHEISEGSIESIDIVKNLSTGTTFLNKLENLFIGLSKKADGLSQR